MKLGVYPDYESHPFRALREAGVIVTVNSGDPPLFNSTVNVEVVAFYNEMGMDFVAIEEALLDAVRVSFAPESERAAREVRFREEMERHHLEHLHDARLLD